MARWFWLAALPIGLLGGAAGAQDAEAILNGNCAACHERTDGGLARIKDQRKTPEGWDMTIVRMMLLHGVEVTDDERATLVKHLADTQGLAPAETEGLRYILEREPGAIEEPPSDEMGAMCARCHSWARVALQRRTEDEWRLLSHFHLGQYPTAEYQALGRDRNWWEIASEQLPGKLAKMFPLETDAWDAWRAHPHPDLAGRYRMIGEQTGRGSFEGTSEVSADGDDAYSYHYEITFADGASASGDGQGIVYTGYEWRGTTEVSGGAVREVYRIADDGSEATGRFFLADSDAQGGHLRSVRMDGEGRVLAVWPPYLRAGESAELKIHGFGLAGDVSLGDGVTIDEVVASDDQTVVVRARAAADAADGPRAASIGEAAGEGLLTVYQKIDHVTVEPSYTIARVGGGGGPLPPVPAQFQAMAWLAGPDGESGTEDDVEIGVMPAKWSVANFDEVAEDLEDAQFAGEMQANGLFVPAAAGPNPERPFDTNNAGNLKVIATVEDGGQTLTGEGQLLVTVQRWNDPPIR